MGGKRADREQKGIRERFSAKWAAEMIKGHKIALFAAANIFFFAVSLFSFWQARMNIAAWTLTKEEYTNSALADASVDESCEAGLYAVTDVFLPKGYYRYRVNFRGDSPNSLIYPHFFTDRYKGVDKESLPLTEGVQDTVLNFCVHADLNVSFYIEYSGEGSAVIESIEIEQTPVLINQQLFYRLLFLLAADLVFALYCYHKKYGVKESAVYGFGALVVLTVAASFPATTGNTYLGHDLFFHLTRIEGLKDGLLSGQFPVRINPDFYRGYGYANPIMYGEVLLYLPALLRIAGISMTGVYNAYIFLVNFLTAASAYWCFSKMCGDKLSGMTAAVLYVMTPYRLMDMYIRAAAGEYTAMIFIPLVIYGMYRIYTEDPKEKGYGLCFLTLTAGISGLIQTHILTGEMAAIFIILTCVLFLKRTFQKARFFALVKAAGATVLLNLWFLVPFADYYFTQDLRLRAGLQTGRIQKTGAHFTQLIALFNEYAWGNVDGGGETAIGEEIPLSLGLALFLGLILCVCMIFTAGKEEKTAVKRAVCLLGMGTLATWMATIYFPWDRVVDLAGGLGNLVKSVQFAWRYLSPASALTAAAAAFGLALLWRRKKEGSQSFCCSVAVGLSLLACIGGIFFMTECMNKAISLQWQDLEADTHVAAMNGEYVLCKAQYDVIREIEEPRVSDGIGMENYEKSGTNVRFDVKGGSTDGHILLPLLAYKGYTVRSDGGVITKDSLSEGPAAELSVNIPAGYSGTVRISFEGFWYWRAAEIVSLCSLAVLVAAYVREKRGKRG